MGAMNAEEMKNYKGVFVFAQQVDNKLSGISCLLYTSPSPRDS